MKEVKLKIELDQQGIYHQPYHPHKKPALTPRTKFIGACEALNRKTLSGNRADNFKITLDNIVIYV